jgi:hypothetical protein
MNKKLRLHVHIAGQSSDNQTISTHQDVNGCIYYLGIGYPRHFSYLKYNPSTSIIITEQAIYRKQLPRSQHITWPTWLKGALVPFVSAKRHKCAFIFIPIVRQYHCRKKLE